MKRSLLTWMSISAFAVSLSACQTGNALRAQFLEHSYENVNGRMLADAPNHRVAALERTLLTDQLDNIKTTQDGKEVGLTVQDRVNQRETLREKLSRGLTAHEVEKAELGQSDNVVLEGKGVSDLTVYIQSIVDRLLAHWPHEPLNPPVSIYLVDNPLYNARMTGLNALYLHTGFLLNAGTEDELAAMLAHELAHALLQHTNAEDWVAVENKLMNIGMSLVVSRFAGAELQNATLGASGKANTAIAMLLAEKQLRQLNNEVLFKSWQRHQEDQADMLAVDLLYEAGYDWTFIQTVLERVGHSEEQRAALSAAAVKASGVDAPDSPAAALAEMREKLSSMSFVDLFGDAAKDHADAEDRLLNVTMYMEREYPDADLPPLADDTSYRKAVFEGPGFDAIRKRHFLELARTALLAEDFDAAANHALKTLDSATDPSIEARILLFNARKGAGKTTAALQNLEIARQGSQATMALFDALVSEYTARGDGDTAAARWDEARRRLILDDRTYFPRLVRIHGETGRLDKAAQVVAACASREKQEPLLASDCRWAFKSVSPPAATTPGAGRKA